MNRYPASLAPRFASQKVAFVFGTSILGGAELYGTNLMCELDPARYRPVVICPATGDLPALAKERGLPVLPLQVPERLAGSARATFSFSPRAFAPMGAAAVAAAVATAEQLRRTGTRLVHINSMKAGLFAAPAARLLGLPVIWDFKDLVTADHYSATLRRVVVTYLNLFATRVIANSGAIRLELVRAGVEPSKVDALHNGVDLKRFSPETATAARAKVRAELGLADDVPIAIIVGRLAPWKGHSVFIRAAAHVHTQLPRARFLVAGDTAFDPPAYRAELEALAAAHNLGESLRFLGFRDDVQDVMGAADVLVHCSIWPEPLGLTPIEAMALGRPVVAADAGGPRETVADGETGLLTPPGDADALADALMRLLGNADERARMGTAGRARAERLFDLRENARAVMSVYDQVPRGRGLHLRSRRAYP